jgi:hypothetical protein
MGGDHRARHLGAEMRAYESPAGSHFRHRNSSKTLIFSKKFVVEPAAIT